MRTRARILGATAVAAAVVVTVPVLTSSSAHAARFTGGNVVVYRVGDGGAALTNAAACPRAYLTGDEAKRRHQVSRVRTLRLL